MSENKEPKPRNKGGALRTSAKSEAVRPPSVFRRWMGPGSVKVFGKRVERRQIEIFTPEESANMSERLWAFATEEEWEAEFEDISEKRKKRARKQNNFAKYNAEQAKKKDAEGGDS